MKILNETVGHFDALRLHRMILAKDVLSYLFIVNVSDWLCHKFLQTIEVIFLNIRQNYKYSSIFALNVKYVSKIN